MNIPAKPSLMVAMATRYAMDPVKFQEVIKRTVMPKEASIEHMAAYLMLCREYGLNPLLKHVHCYISQGDIKLVISIDGWAYMVQNHPKSDGVDFSYQYEDGTGQIAGITCTMHRKDWTHPVRVTEFMAENYRATQPWKQSPQRMLRHRAFIQAARIAFGMSGAFAGEDVPESDYLEMEAEPVPAVEAPKPPRPPSPPKKEPAKPEESFPTGHDGFLEELETSLASADDEETLKTIYNDHDIEERLAGDSRAIDQAQDAFLRHMNRLKKD